MNALLVRVGADQSTGGGNWNGIVDSSSRQFAYVAIPETKNVHPGMQRPYSALVPILQRFGVTLPGHLARQHMHLDPDFEHLTYGDHRERAKQIRTHLSKGDVIVFYAGLRDISRASAGLMYAIIGLLEVGGFEAATDVVAAERDQNAHSRRVHPGESDLIVRGCIRTSGRLQTCVPIGEYRDRAYRVRSDLLATWGGLSVRDGYLQRSARLPRFLDAPRFMRWFRAQRQDLIQANN